MASARCASPARASGARPTIRTRPSAVLRRVRRARRRPHRHGRLLRPGGQRGPDRRGAAPVPGRPRDRDQGRPAADRSGPVAARRAPGAAAGVLRGQPAAPAASTASTSTSSTRPIPQVPLEESRRRARRAAGRGQDPPRRRLERDARRARQRARDRRRRLGAEPLQPRRPRLRGRARRLRARRASGSSRGSRSPPGGSPSRAAPLDESRASHDATPGAGRPRVAARALAVMLPIPGTSSVAHLEENMAAAQHRAVRGRGCRDWKSGRG